MAWFSQQHEISINIFFCSFSFLSFTNDNILKGYEKILPNYSFPPCRILDFCTVLINNMVLIQDFILNYIYIYIKLYTNFWLEYMTTTFKEIIFFSKKSTIYWNLPSLSATVFISTAEKSWPIIFSKDYKRKIIFRIDKNVYSGRSTNIQIRISLKIHSRNLISYEP